MIASRLPRRTTISLWQRPRHSLGVTPGAERSMPLIAVATRRLITLALLGTLVCLHTLAYPDPPDPTWIAHLAPSRAATRATVARPAGDLARGLPGVTRRVPVLDEAGGLEFVPNRNSHDGHVGAEPGPPRGARVEFGHVDHYDSALVAL